MGRVKVAAEYKRHRIIMPVYIPDTTGYYAQAIDVLRMCLDSLFATVDDRRVSVTIINNASTEQVDELLTREFLRGKIDRYIRHQVNRGKPDAVAGEILASHETFVTLADSDALFLQGWLEEVERVFAAFPGTGSVSPFPAPKQHFYYAANTWLVGALGLRLRRGSFADSSDLAQFAQSIGKTDFYDRDDHEVQFAVERGRTLALIGGGHFVVTLRRRAYDAFTYQPALSGLGSGIRKIDEQIERAGYMRLSTPKAWVLHMGNVPETWMRDKTLEVVARASVTSALAEPEPRLTDASRPPIAILPYALRRMLAQPFRVYAGLIKRFRRRSIGV